MGLTLRRSPFTVRDFSFSISWAFQVSWAFQISSSKMLPDNITRHCSNCSPMLAHRLWYWPNIRPTRFIVSCLLLYTPIHYFIILDSVSHGELIPLHLPRSRASKMPLKNKNDCFVYFILFLARKNKTFVQH